ASTTGFQLGDFVVINPGGSDTEVFGPITGFASLDAANGTKNAHNAGELIVDQSNSSVQQVVQIPVQGASITITEPTGSGGADPIDVLNVTTTTIPGSNGTCQTATGGKQVLTGEPFYACGALAPVTIVNARGTDTPWNVTGQVTDFLDSVAPAGTTCDDIAHFNAHCIPGGNLQWGPVAAVSSDLVPGDVGQITAGPSLANVPYTPATTAAETNPALAGAKSTPGGTAQGATIGATMKAGWTSSGTFGITPAAGLTGGGVTLCSTSSGTAGGTFTCGADLMVAVPASASATGSPYQATLTLTLA
ncbi:MAG TPA: hypothetical protein VNY84_08045, partial [Acidimicrobiales bacterium]|nr:hypothetical protein [Acidimicrobiales bacterium]